MNRTTEKRSPKVFILSLVDYVAYNGHRCFFIREDPVRKETSLSLSNIYGLGKIPLGAKYFSFTQLIRCLVVKFLYHFNELKDVYLMTALDGYSSDTSPNYGSFCFLFYHQPSYTNVDGDGTVPTESSKVLSCMCLIISGISCNEILCN